MGLISQLLQKAVLSTDSPPISKPALDEVSMRHPSFVKGKGIRLADGQTWWLPERSSDPVDDEYDAVLDLLTQCEDHAETLRAELAMTIFLLKRNYDLALDELCFLLKYRENDSALAKMQEEVHAFALEQLRTAQERHGRDVQSPGRQA